MSRAQLPVKTRSRLREHSRVQTLRAFDKKDVKAGDTGTIVHVYDDGGYEVEFVAGRKRPAVVTVEPGDVEPGGGRKYEVQCVIETPDKLNPCILSVWIKTGDAPPRLVTAHPND